MKVIFKITETWPCLICYLLEYRRETYSILVQKLSHRCRKEYICHFQEKDSNILVWFHEFHDFSTSREE